MHLAHARDLRGGVTDRTHARPCDEEMHLAQLGGGGDGGKGGVLDGAAVVLDPNQRLHAATPMLFSFATSSSTSATFTPAERLVGSETLRVCRRVAVSTP